VDDAPPPGSAGDRAYRRGFKRGDRREDYAVDLFREAEASLLDTSRVSAILLELSRYYNPLIHGPIIDLHSRRRVVEAIESGRHEEAREILRQRLACYLGPGEGKREGEEAGEGERKGEGNPG
jgi:DNA-binding GntR family transcriptional regulator